jgi:hypothetical protein
MHYRKANNNQVLHKTLIPIRKFGITGNGDHLLFYYASVGQDIFVYIKVKFNNLFLLVPSSHNMLGD